MVADLLDAEDLIQEAEEADKAKTDTPHFEGDKVDAVMSKRETSDDTMLSLRAPLYVVKDRNKNAHKKQKTTATVQIEKPVEPIRDKLTAVKYWESVTANEQGCLQIEKLGEALARRKGELEVIKRVFEDMIA